jgi:hypothetical protein
MHANIHSIRKQTAALRAALLAPSIEAFESHLPALQEAGLTLQRLQTHLLDSPLRPELEALAKELRSTGMLIEHGLAFQQGLARLLASATSGYRPDGEPVSLRAAGNISVRG